MRWSNPSILWGRAEWERASFSAEGGSSVQVTRGNEVIDRSSLASNMLPRGEHPSRTVIVSFISGAAIPPGSLQ